MTDRITAQQALNALNDLSAPIAKGASWHLVRAFLTQAAGEKEQKSVETVLHEGWAVIHDFTRIRLPNIYSTESEHAAREQSRDLYTDDTIKVRVARVRVIETGEGEG